MAAVNLSIFKVPLCWKTLSVWTTQDRIFYLMSILTIRRQTLLFFFCINLYTSFGVPTSKVFFNFSRDVLLKWMAFLSVEVQLNFDLS